MGGEQGMDPDAAPVAFVADVSSAAGVHAMSLASLLQRFLGALIDESLAMAAVAPVLLGGTTWPLEGVPRSMAYGSGALLLCALLSSNAVLLHRRGQSVGKRIVGSRIVRTDGTPVSLARVLMLRGGLTLLIGMIPFVGGILRLLDAAAILGSDERLCIHDIVADTKVVRA